MKVNLGVLCDGIQDSYKGKMFVVVKPFSPGKEKEFKNKYLENRKEELVLLKEELERLK